MVQIHPKIVGFVPSYGTYKQVSRHPNRRPNRQNR